MVRTSRAVSLLVVAALVLGRSVGPAYAATPPPTTTAPVAMISNIQGVPLWAKSGQSQRAVASTIKMLNALVVRDRARLNDVVVVTRKAQLIEDGDVGLVAGQRLTVQQLLDMMLVASANDAAEALAIHISETEPRYVALMNAKARQIGLQKTYAADPHGLGKRERSCAQDLTILARRVLADPVLRKSVRKQSVIVPHPGKRSTVMRSTWHLMGTYAGIEGVKTGYTRASGYCFVGAARRGGVELVGVVLGARSNADRFAQMRRLLDWGFANTRVCTLVSSATTVTVPVGGASESGVSPTRFVLTRPARTISMPLLKGSGTVARRVRASSVTTTAIVAGAQVALLDLCLGSRVLATVPVLAIQSWTPVSSMWIRIPRQIPI